MITGITAALLGVVIFFLTTYIIDRVCKCIERCAGTRQKKAARDLKFLHIKAMLDANYSVKEITDVLGLDDKIESEKSEEKL